MSEHTPGPWIPSIHGFNVVTADSMFSICAVHAIHGSRANEIGHEAARLELRANSRLIAAAPDLLQAAQASIDSHRAVSSNGHEVIIGREAFAALVAALEKATGEKVLPEHLAVPCGERGLYYWGG